MLDRIARDRVATLFIVTVLVLLAVGAAAPGFLSVRTAGIIWSNGLVLMLVALGIFPVILTRNIDVSGGSVLGLSAVTLGLTLNQGLPLPLASAAAVGTGILAGALSGLLVAVLRVPSIVATLGTLGLFRGVMLIATGGEWIEDLPEDLKALGAKSFAGLSVMGMVTAAAIVAVWLFLRSRRGGWVFVTGDNRAAAHHLGLPVKWIEFLVFVWGGAMYALAGIAFAAQIGFVPNQAGSGIELRAIAALVLGGVSLLGGVGTVAGVVIGVIFFTSIDTSLVFLRIPAYWNDLIGGAMLLAVLLIDGRLRIALEARDRAARYRRSSHRISPARDLEDAA
ncbi:autoinducer 2 ABC transporter permease LsrC [Rhodobacter sphaeroides]|jgi:Ribose/xylose/arabinose/galactoside ABC-type transport systems, permease components|uniref:Autoinducer 2 import system permease protein LsrC n=1 Tax=Cereibacter sphaeroides (strain ATCC 17023 / DSM 158 / JCM 6121 / CCUG 31486 / LMG 2827 / NBRC 12203 / NCIMB 8253 / ATH 2.4.1.) TaxID=272943 RepID=Q3IWH8_CERS4|nr:autoinducer 2 ABC transporter permease LsrC [Cereibacter sphaeroides]ABA81106.1 monosaccharide ABC transporter membrane protein, CUT2 family [Cereibacter sphaeroides 2.4.1]AMJ49422.1 ABC transporter permease [Cereibacter sphaeroides]ANS36130.1 ABC transporter permease [Cereibacter sphaeroides]ATN65195.1 ABC transporter permease [Cereibacter sphaeroides]AXC63398.1 autoinducer 2 ABC transporter permease LsrC [Cereibacter sphaeroides 2.4.1]